MPRTVDLLSPATLTAAINERKSPNNFLHRLLFPSSRDKTVATKDIELGYKRRGRVMAPFVKRGSAGLYTKGGTEHFATVRAPHIRTKRPMTPSDLFDHRRPGMPIFASNADLLTAQRQYVAEQQEDLMDEIDNTEEWMAAMCLRGVISYSSDDEAFEIDMRRLSAHDITLESDRFWTETTAKIQADFLLATTLTHGEVGGNVKNVILGSEAAAAFMDKMPTEQLLDTRRLNTGMADFTKQIEDSGALYLGSPFHSINVWRYDRQVEMPDGTTVDLIRPKYAEFVTDPRVLDSVTYYGAVEDFDAMGGSTGLAQTKRFSKSWIEKDPSARIMLVESNPLPFFRRPNGCVSMKVIAG